jgi:hypothetical protein
LLITDILKRTSKDNSDYVKLEKALTVTKEVMTYVFYCMLVWSVEKNIKDIVSISPRMKSTFNRLSFHPRL